MTQTEVNDAICEALNNLYNWDVSCFHYWMDELYDGDDEVLNNWTEENLNLIEKDMMYAFNEVSNGDDVEMVGK
jgi:hypothetical protein